MAIRADEILNAVLDEVEDEVQRRVASGTEAYELSPDDAKALDTVDSPEQMETTALRLSNASLRAKALPSAKKDTPVGTGKIDLTKLSIEERLGMALEHKI